MRRNLTINCPTGQSARVIHQQTLAIAHFIFVEHTKKNDVVEITAFSKNFEHKLMRMKKEGSVMNMQVKFIEELKQEIRGEVLLPNDAGYDEARTLWNAMIDRKPGMIVRCAGVGDVMRSVRLAHDHNLLVSVRGGGHNIAGNAVCDDGLMIDLSLMKSVRVDPIARRAYVEPGVTLGRRLD
jgi:hypothetical protein